MATYKMDTTWQRCATCAHWGGTRRPADPACRDVEYDNNEFGKCYGDGNGGWNSYRGNDSCSHWAPQYRK